MRIRRSSIAHRKNELYLVNSPETAIPPRVLIIDDDPVVRELVGEFLQTYGMEVRALESGRHWRDIVAESPVDVILLDYMMPDATGHQLLAEIRAHPTCRALPVIMLSADMREQRSAEVPGIAPDRYLEKPFAPPLLAQTIRELLAQR